MSKAGKEIIAGAEQALAYLKGDKTKGRAYKVRVKDVDVKAIREKLRMTQEVFSETFAIPVSTLKKWEANHRVPEGPTKAYLMVIDKNPSAVKKALQSAVR
ncbi:MAG: helix-turn-helix domain-containing protein [Thermodesulfobacteriota bacterium]